jgi:hypothetical protein
MPGISRSAPEGRSTTPPDRIQRMRVARGACWVIVAAALGAVALVLLDAAVHLPGWVRGLGLATWLTGTGVLAWRFVVRPWREEPQADETPPTAAQELPGNLSAAAAAALSLVGCLLAGTFVPGAPEHLRRVAFPWQKAAAAQYRVVVTSGEPVVRRGGSVTLTAYVEKLDSAARPASATLVCRDIAGAAERQWPMNSDGNAAFHVTRTAPSNFEYRVEVGGATSEWLSVTALDPVELAEGSTIAILPPKYAPNAPKRVVPGFAAIDGFQHGLVEFHLRFTRPASEASLEFRTDGSPLEVNRVVLAPDGLAGTASLRLNQDGSLRLVLIADENGKKLRTELPANVRLKPDGPPRFTMIRGISPRPMTARPGTVLHIDCEATDDVAVGEVVLEYGLDSPDSRMAGIPISLTGAGTPVAHGHCEFQLADKFRAGETLRFRLRVNDTRRIDETNLRPQEAAYPEGGWATIKLDPSAPEIEDQEILGRRDVVKAALEEAREAAKEAAEDVETVQTESEGKAVLPPEHTIRLSRAREGERKAAGLLHAAAREAALNPELQALAAQVRATADRFLKESDEPLRRAATDAPIDRVGSIALSAKLLTDAVDRIEQLLALNDRLARARLDTRALTLLAGEQASLAEKAATLSASELVRKQQELIVRFQRLLTESEALRGAADAAQQQEFDRLAASVSDLAGMVRELNTAATQLHADARAFLLMAATAEQKALAAKAAALLVRVETAARLANVALPKAAEFDAVTDQLAAGRSTEALVEMVLRAGALEPVASTFEKWAADRVDPKVAAKHLALWQDDLRARFRTLTAGNSANYAALQAVTKDAFRTEQAAIRKAAGSLQLPAGDNAIAAIAARDAALEHLASVDGFLAANGANADTAMNVASDSLVQLAGKIPTITDRLIRSRSEFDRIWRDQDPILSAADAALRNSPTPAALAKKLAPLIDAQKKLAAAFAALDLPRMESRRLRINAALLAALTDLKDNSPQDILVSQRWAKRELERLKIILIDAAVPPDDRADDLTRRLESMVKAAETIAAGCPDVSQLNWAFLTQAGEAAIASWANVQFQTHAVAMQEILRQFNQLPAAAEAAVLQYDAREVLQIADMGFRNGSKPQEVLRRVNLAAIAVGKLSDRLSGGESELERVRRLAEYRRVGAAAITASGSAANPTLAAEIARELGREIEELTNTRVGAAGQLRKKWLLAEYARLKEHATPELMIGIHNGLATGLDELAAVMADIDDLTSTFDRKPPVVAPDDADAFLPSRLLADELRDIARSYRRSHEQLTHLPEELIRRTKPTDAKPIAEVEKKQRSLAGEIAKFAESLSAKSVIFPADPEQIAAVALLAADRLHDGSLSAAKDAAQRTGWALRALATSEKAKGAGEFAARQEAILKELAPLFDSPGVAAAQQRIRADELMRQTNELIKGLEAAALDAGLVEAAGKALNDAANTAKAAGKLLAEATRKAEAGRAEDAAALRTEAEALLRAAAGKAAGAGIATTTLPRLDPDTAAIGTALRRAEKAMRQASRDLGEKPAVGPAGTAMGVAAESLGKAAKAIGEQLGGAERK